MVAINMQPSMFRSIGHSYDSCSYSCRTGLHICRRSRSFPPMQLGPTLAICALWLKKKIAHLVCGSCKKYLSETPLHLSVYYIDAFFCIHIYIIV